MSRIKLTLTPDAEPVEVLAGARDRVRGGGVVLPEDAEDPFVHEVENRFPVIAVFVYGSADPLTLKRLAEDEARGLEALPGVANVQSTGLIEPRLWVEVDPDALERHGLTFADVERAVAMRVAEAPLGALVSEKKERSRGSGRRYSDSRRSCEGLGDRRRGARPARGGDRVGEGQLARPLQRLAVCPPPCAGRAATRSIARAVHEHVSSRARCRRGGTGTSATSRLRRESPADHVRLGATGRFWCSSRSCSSSARGGPRHGARDPLPLGTIVVGSPA